MRIERLRSVLAAVAILAATWSVPGWLSAQESDAEPVPSCSGKCRGLGLDKVKAADEHCGYVSRERKLLALEAACTLAESQKDKLQARARERAENKCTYLFKREGCSCEGEFLRWENVYTNQLSGRCWAECGWAFRVDCDRASANGKPDSNPSSAEAQE